MHKCVVPLKSLLVLFVVFATLSCENQVRDIEAGEMISFADFHRKPSELDGKVVSLRGYLISNGGDLAIYQDLDTLLNGRNNSKKRVFVVDSSLGQILRTESETNGYVCTRRSVRLVGTIGVHPAREIYSVVRIHSIEVFADANYTTSEGFCYEAEISEE